MQKMEESRKKLVEDTTAAFLEESKVWRQIDISESHMVSGMFEEAATLSASVVKQLRSSTSMNWLDSTLIAEMTESAGMVFIQSWKELGRTRELFDELVKLFGSVAAIPVQVFLATACMQISEGHSRNLHTIFEEFLEKWVYVSDKEKVLPNTESNSFSESWQCDISVEKYTEVVDIYTITILGTILCKPDVAISWVEKAVLPDEKREGMLRKLHSLQLAAHLSSPPENKAGSTKEGRVGTKADTELKEHSKINEQKAYVKSFRPSIERISDRKFKLKFGNFPLILPRGKTVFLSSLVLFTFYIFLKKWAVLKRILGRQASSVRKALIDAWQLAFSVQVNPLAAVQQLPAAMPRGS